jgi:ribonuclease D
LDLVVQKLSQGSGPIAFDAERASGFRYGQRAYLVQLRRNGSGTHLIDPTCFENLDAVQQVTKGTDWILHAASQDLVCLAEVGLKPTALLFDTEVAGRILGLPKVGLGTLVETELGFQLAKEHSAADWSKRPLPTDWLNYAALDVEFLFELWDVLSAKLTSSGKYEWALEEFAYVRDNTIPIVRTEPWRRTSGLHGARKPRQLAIVRALWEARESIAQERDTAPGRILPDTAIIAMAHAVSETTDPLEDLEVFNSRLANRYRKRWITTVNSALALSDSDLPAAKLHSTAPPAPRMWQERNPVAYAQLEQVRSELSALSESLSIPIENLLTPDTVRRILWNPPHTADELQTQLRDMGARAWQSELSKPILERALFEPLKTTEVATELSDSTEQ